MGLPGWAFPTILAAIGLLVFMLGLKLETDWPEGLGALMVSGGLAWGEFMLGWEKFQLGGMIVVPYVLPVLVFLVLMGWSMVASK
jgi:cytochrome c oxidase subunit IV